MEIDGQSLVRELGGNLKGRDVLIFGGTSGIGLAAAIQAKSVGAHVIIVGKDPTRAEKTAAEYGLHSWRAADVTNIESIEGALADVAAVDHLVMLAGTFSMGKILETDIADLRRPLEERVWAAINVIRILGDRLAPNGSITLSSGTLSDRPNADGTAVLAATAAAVEALGRALSLELAPRRVNTLSPGPVDTPLLTKVIGQANRDAYVEHLKSILPLKRIGTVEEAGAAVVFLMSNGWMNGATLNLDGGSRLV